MKKTDKPYTARVTMRFTVEYEIDVPVESFDLSDEQIIEKFRHKDIFCVQSLYHDGDATYGLDMYKIDQMGATVHSQCAYGDPTATGYLHPPKRDWEIEIFNTQEK